MTCGCWRRSAPRRCHGSSDATIHCYYGFYDDHDDDDYSHDGKYDDDDDASDDGDDVVI